MLSDDNNKIQTNATTDDGIIDINLDTVKRTKFRINGDPNAIIELDLSDLRIVDRLNSGMKDLQDEMSKISSLPDDASETEVSEVMKQADLKMREYIDYIFDYPVSQACAKNGTMYDPKDGKFRYEAIIEGLIKLYTENINAEYEKIQQRMSKHTDKYIAIKNRKK